VALLNGSESTADISLMWQELGWQNEEVTGVAWPVTRMNSTSGSGSGGVSSEVLPHQAVPGPYDEHTPHVTSTSYHNRADG
jgi:hypothetical protein